MNVRSLFLAGLFLFGAGALVAAERTRVTIVATTDLHGHINPIDYYTNQPQQTGLAKAATIIRSVRKEDPQMILLDSGDTIQGTPLIYYHNRHNNRPPDPMMLVMNSLGYDAMVIGNHEYNFGLDVLKKAEREAAFPWLSGNTYRSGSAETAYRPYIIKETNGVKVGILGLTTPGVPSWENPENFAGLEFRSPVLEAKKWVRVLREKEKVDLVVLAMHMGIEEDLATGAVTPGQVPQENAAVAIARQVPGVDVMLLGHTHREVPSLYLNGAMMTQAGRWGNCVVRADVYLEKNAEGRWQVLAKGSRTIPITEKVAADPEVLKLSEPYDRETQAWLSKVIGHSDRALSAQDAYFKDNALLDLIHRVQLETGQADVSMAAAFNTQATVKAGDVTVRDIAGLYVYENTLVVVEATGAQIKTALEHSARFFGAYNAGGAPDTWIDRRIPGYNYDTAEGITYDVDASKPEGSRIRNVLFKGKPLEDSARLRVAINNYRLNGGGGYAMFKDTPVVFRSSMEIRDLIIRWVEKNGVIATEPSGNWHLLPVK